MRRELTACCAAIILAGCVNQAGVETAQPAPADAQARATGPAITAADLKQRLSIFADDSMEGRAGGTEGNNRGTRYIEAQVRALGLKPGGENGTYFQNVPLVQRTLAASSQLSIGGTRLAAWSDFVPIDPGSGIRAFAGAATVYGGVFGDTTLSPAAAAGKVVVLTSPPGLQALRFPRGGISRYADAAAIIIATPEETPAPLAAQLRSPRATLPPANLPPTSAAVVLMPPRVVSQLFGGPLTSIAPGTVGKPIDGTLVYEQVERPARNVVAILPGSDPALRGEFVAIGGHNDHIGVRHPAVDRDSMRAFNTALYRISGKDRITPEMRAQVHVNMDSIRKLYPTPRVDSINNGADDDGSGSVSVLEIAEAFAKQSARPKRSILFVWHTGEELGLLGSRWFTDRPTVPRDSIVAQLNMDMVGRGGADDIPGGGPKYLQLVGSRRLSTELGDIVESVNKTQKSPFEFDYTFDANGHPENIYCRSDHYMYARYGIPVTFFTTGLHKDYHQVTDEVQFIDFDHMARVDQLVYDIAIHVADMDHRVVVDKAKPDPLAPCRQ